MLTCMSCNIKFSLLPHHGHYTSDWHIYNLKRRVAGLPALTKAQFEERETAFLVANEEKDSKVSVKCIPCNKHFSSDNAMLSHTKSKKHLQAATKKKREDANNHRSSSLNKFDLAINDTNNDDAEWSDNDWESCDEEDVTKVTVDTNDCLFCDHESDSTENNVKHMTEVHSFYIADIEYVSDLDGLIGFLAGKIHVGHLCLWCNGKGKGFKSVKSVKQHMVDKGHCKMLHEGEALLDYADFYDYSSSDAVKENFDEVIRDLIEDLDYELVLPSGATVGHRSLALYYKQNLGPISSDNAKKVKDLHHYKALGYSGCTGPAALKKARDIVLMQRIISQYSLKLGVKANKLQPRFRSQVMF